MAIYTHPDGYLQIDAAEPIHLLGESNILPRLYKGWNQRRGVAGLPYLAYSRSSFLEVDSIQEAIIAQDSIIQAVTFWRTLQSGLWDLVDFPKQGVFAQDRRDYTADVLRRSALWFIRNPAGGAARWPTGVVADDGAGFGVTADWLGHNRSLGAMSATQETIYGTDAGAFERLFRVWNDRSTRTAGYIQAGDIISGHLVNDLLRVMWEIQWAHGWIRHADTAVELNLNAAPSQDPCGAVRARMVGQWESVVASGTYFTVANYHTTGCTYLEVPGGSGAPQINWYGSASMQWESGSVDLSGAPALLDAQIIALGLVYGNPDYFEAPIDRWGLSRIGTTEARDVAGGVPSGGSSWPVRVSQYAAAGGLESPPDFLGMFCGNVRPDANYDERGIIAVLSPVVRPRFADLP